MAFPPPNRNPSLSSRKVAIAITLLAFPARLRRPSVPRPLRPWRARRQQAASLTRCRFAHPRWPGGAEETWALPRTSAPRPRRVRPRRRRPPVRRWFCTPTARARVDCLSTDSALAPSPLSLRERPQPETCPRSRRSRLTSLCAPVAARPMAPPPAAPTAAPMAPASQGPSTLSPACKPLPLAALLSDHCLHPGTQA